MSRILDRIAGLLGAWAIKRLYNPQCTEYVEGCVECEAKKLMLVMQGIAFGKR